MNKDMEAFRENRTIKTAKAVLKHANKISAQCVFGDELEEAKSFIEKWGK